MAVPSKWLITLYTVLAFILVSHSGTYKITHSIYSALGGKQDEEDYGTGMDFTNQGFLLHVLVFALLIFVPMLDVIKRKFN